MTRARRKLRLYLRRFGWRLGFSLMLFWAAAAGVLGALATILFHYGIYALQWLVSGQSGSIVRTIESLPWYGRLLFPVAGGFVAGCLLWLAEKNQSKASSDYMEAVVIGSGRLSVRQGFLRSLSSLFSVASGGSIGREGAMVHLGAVGASVLGRVARFPTDRLRLLVACGSAAGVAAAYGAPIAGALFIAEIVLGTMVIQSVGPLLVAAAVANFTMRTLGDYQVLYSIGNIVEPVGWQILAYVLLGLLAGVVAPLFLKLLNASRQLFGQMGLALPLRLSVGGFLLGLLLTILPLVAGNGFSVVSSLLSETWTWHAIIVILFFKVIATALTVGSGAVGGVFTPTLFVGAAFGHLFALLMTLIWPELSGATTLFTLVGMGAFLGAATGAPLMAIVMLFEMTLSYQLVLPLMLACVPAYFVARTIAEVAMYDVTLSRERDLQFRQNLRYMTLATLVRPADTVVVTSSPIKEAAQMFLDYPVKYLYVVDEDNVFQGVISQQDLTSLLLAKGDLDEQTAGDVVRLDFVQTLYPDMTMDEAQERFANFTGERLPVVSRQEKPRLLGVVYKSALLEKYSELKRSVERSTESLAELGNDRLWRRPNRR